jgi:hypothetical protein
LHQSITDSIIIVNGFITGNIEKTFSTAVPADYIISQVPEAGSKVPLGTPINLVISLGKVDNVALNKNASSDSEESSKGNTADKGNDGNTSTRWCANNGNLNHWWKVDLGSYYNLIGSEVMWEFDGQIYRYNIAVSSDNVQWKVVVNKSNNTLTSQTQQDLFTADNVRYVRITITGLASGCWASFWEFKVFISSLTGIEFNTHGEIIPKEFKLFQNYPNPFNPTTRINYQLPVDSQVTLKIYDILGKETKTLLNGPQVAGYYSVSLNLDNLSSGIYFYNLKAGNFIETKKMVLFK